MKKIILMLSLLLGLIPVSYADEIIDMISPIGIIQRFENGQPEIDKVKLPGIYQEVDTLKDIQAIELLQSGNEQQKESMVNTILTAPNNYTPPVLYVLSDVLFKQGNKDEAAFWFYVGQMRARYDATLCLDKSAGSAISVLNDRYGVQINQYMFQDMDKLKKIMGEVYLFVRDNQENYDHRWINLYGLKALQAGIKARIATTLAEARELLKEAGQESKLPAKATASSVDEPELSRPQSKWPAIKRRTIDRFYNSFLQYAKDLDK